MLETDDPELRERLVHRADDNEEAVKRRLEIYQVGACGHPHPGDPVSLRLFLPCPLVPFPSFLYSLQNQVDDRFAPRRTTLMGSWNSSMTCARNSTASVRWKN